MDPRAIAQRVNLPGVRVAVLSPVEFDGYRIELRTRLGHARFDVLGRELLDEEGLRALMADRIQAARQELLDRGFAKEEGS